MEPGQGVIVRVVVVDNSTCPTAINAGEPTPINLLTTNCFDLLLQVWPH